MTPFDTTVIQNMHSYNLRFYEHLLLIYMSFVSSRKPICIGFNCHLKEPAIELSKHQASLCQSTFNHMTIELDNGIASFTLSRDTNPILDKLSDVSEGISPFTQIKSSCTVHVIVRTKGRKFFRGFMAD